jgi:uncharacterized LabA/DUF88 family protein
MISPHDNVSMALFCDFENVALGVRDANYEKFDIRMVLERLLLKGSIVIKKAYCDWDRYKAFKAPMHEANFELIEIPHVRQSGKNSADIRLVVDALDLCYTKSHLDTFVIISGDSDFSPLVSKLRENAKHVIGVGVKHSTSDLLIANCDEFIFYDDLVRENARASARDAARDSSGGRRANGDDRRRKEDVDVRRSQAIDIAVETFDALVAERGDAGKIWASALKDAIKRRKPDFNESYYGFRAFGNLLEEAQARGLLEVGRDEKSGAYVYRSNIDRAESAAPAALPPAGDGGRGTGSRSRTRGRRTTRESTGTATSTQVPEHDQMPASEHMPAPEHISASEHARAPRQVPAPAHGTQARPTTRDAMTGEAMAASDTSMAQAPASPGAQAPQDKPKRPSRRRARTADVPAPSSAMDAPLPAAAPDTPQAMPVVATIPAAYDAVTTAAASDAAPAATMQDAAPEDAAARKPRAARKTAARPRRPRKTAPSTTET